MTTAFDSVKDSGARQEFTTGSRRDVQDDKPRLDLIPTLWLRRLGDHLRNGAVKYGDNNWQLGQPIMRYYGSAMRHMLQWREGATDEDHFAACAWNVLAAMWTENEILNGRLPAELDDRGTRPTTVQERGGLYGPVVVYSPFSSVDAGTDGPYAAV